MPDTCRYGHLKDGLYCRPCRRERQQRYRQTEKGKATHRRVQSHYELTPKGRLSHLGRNIRALAKRHRAMEEEHASTR